MGEHGYRVGHDRDEDGGGFSLRKATGMKTRIYMRNGVFVMPVWIAKHTGGAAKSTREERGSNGGRSGSRVGHHGRGG